MFDIAGIFEQHQAYDVAVGVYRDFAAFAAKVEVLTQAPPGTASVVERAEYAAAGALLAKAKHALHEALAKKQPQQPAPQKISEEFTTAIEAYEAFIKSHPESVLVGPAIRQIMLAALEYVQAGSWDVANAIYADLLGSGLAIRRPERLELCQGLCQLGKVLPEHAKQVLTALTTAPKAARMYLDVPTSEGKGIGGEPKLGPPDVTALPLRADRAGGRRAPSKPKPDDYLREGDMLAMAAVRRHREASASRIAMLRDKTKVRYSQLQHASEERKRAVVVAPVLSQAEIERQEKAFEAGYKVFQSLLKNYPHTRTSKQARGEIMVMVGHWRSLGKWQRAAKLTERFLADNPADAELPKLRLAIARDYLAWASLPAEKKPSTQEMLAEVAARFDKARAQLAEIVKAFPKEKSIVHEAQWDIANSFLTQARAVSAFSATLARGQFVRAAKELLRVAESFHDHPKIGNIPQMLWNISLELAAKAYYDEAVTVWNDLAVHYPTHSLAQQATYRVAQTYQNNLGLPLRAAEVYLELNFTRGGSDQSIQNAIFQIGADLKAQKRWVEALHVLETFVDSFPQHPSAGQALTMVGEIHQANEAWEDAIAAYRRVINEFPSGGWISRAKWAIAECIINLSRWREAMEAYESYLSAYPKDPKATEAKSRIGILKDLARYQGLVDEEGQRKAFDAQYQIAEIVLGKLSNPVKAIIEYRKAAENWPGSHLADDAMFKIGTTYLSMRETEKARAALLAVAEKHPNSPLADDAMFLVGQSYEQEAQQLATVTKEATARVAQAKAQKRAYGRLRKVRDTLSERTSGRIAELRRGGKGDEAEMEAARGAAAQSQYSMANVGLLAEQAAEEVATLTAKQLADRQDKINAALRKAVRAYQKAAKVAAADKADESLLRTAVIYADKLKDSDAAMKTYFEIVRQFSGTAVAEDASWRIAQYYERQGEYAKSIDAYKAFLRNYRSSPRAGAAQFAIAEGYEHLGKWVEAMDAYTNYINNFPDGPMVQKAKEQITWIKTYRL
jgi:TolA-binding protein